MNIYQNDCASASASTPIGAKFVEAQPENIQEVRASLLRDFVFETLAPVEHDSASARNSLNNNDDAGARYHLRRVVECVRAAAKTFRELEDLNGGRA